MRSVPSLHRLYICRLCRKCNLYKVTGARLNEVKLPHVIAMLSWVGNVQNEYLLLLNGWNTVERVDYS